MCYHEVTHLCQSKTLSSPDFESTYTNKASSEALAVCKFRQVENKQVFCVSWLWKCVKFRGASASLSFFQRRTPARPWTDAITPWKKLRGFRQLARRFIMPKTSKRDLDRNVWEGWTPRAFINALEPSIRIIMDGRSWRDPFTSKAELAEYCRDNQPYYKKRVPEVVNYFAEKYGLR